MDEDRSPTELGKEIARLRVAKGWRQPDLAEVAGVGMSTVQRIEGGDNSKLFTLLDICDALDVQLSQVLAAPTAAAAFEENM